MPKGVYQFAKPKQCRTCGADFLPASGTQRSCSTQCKREWARKYGCETTERQYALISGDWGKYFGRLCVRSFNREQLTSNDLLTLLERQNGLCALSGVKLTCILVKGSTCKTNASIDRIDPKGPYTLENIQLVCAIINKFRIDTSVSEFVDWCKKVADHAVCK